MPSWLYQSTSGDEPLLDIDNPFVINERFEKHISAHLSLIFNRMKKTVNRSSKYIFLLLRLIPALRKSALLDNFHINHRINETIKMKCCFHKK